MYAIATCIRTYLILERGGGGEAAMPGHGPAVLQLPGQMPAVAHLSATAESAQPLSAGSVVVKITIGESDCDRGCESKCQSDCGGLSRMSAQSCFFRSSSKLVSQIVSS